jgi:predicted phage baseplate assembly protein
MLRPESPACCPLPTHPPLPLISPGLSVLPRQLEGFPEYRRAMLAAIRDCPALAGWRADGTHDLGVMLIEAWAYVLDITAFYDSMVANRGYVATATDEKVMRDLMALIGYVPRPALVARVKLALEAAGEDKVVAPAGTGFRSEASDEEPPQVFELLVPADVWPQRNSWTLAPYRRDEFDGILRFLPGAGPGPGAVVAVAAGEARFAGRVSGIETAAEADGIRYQRVRFEEGDPVELAGQALAGMTADILTTRAAPTPLKSAVETVISIAGYDHVVLDTLYPQLAVGQQVVIEANGTLAPAKLELVKRIDHPQPTGDPKFTAAIPLTSISFPTVGLVTGQSGILVHIAPRRLGAPTRPAETELTLDQIRAHGVLERPVKPLGAASGSGDAIMVGALKRGEFVPGTIVTTADGSSRFEPQASPAAFAEPLVTPIRIHGNVVEAVRGETVGSETLGSGDARLGGQRFTLRKKPLSWTVDASMPLGRSPQITVRVDGIEWTYVESFYGRDAGERIYRVTMAADGAATVVFGDGVNGARLTSGVNNITASYRWGAGGTMPPGGSIRQFSRPARNLTRVVGPLAAFGGADAETAGDIRAAAPAAMLSLGRAVSVADFEAMVRSYSGIANAAVAYSWDQVRHEAGILAWIISEAADVSSPLAAFLAARSVPGLAIRVATATPITVPVFDIAIQAAAGHAAETVRTAVRTALFDPGQGLFSRRRVAISQPLFRSRLIAEIHAVPGVASVVSITTATGEMPKAMTLADGQWLDLLSHGQVL